MNDTPKRRWFQFHLNTMVLLAILSGLIYLINSTNRDDGLKEQYGWPFPAYIVNHFTPISDSGVDTIIDRPSVEPIRYKAAAGNLIVAFGILLLVGFCAEFSLLPRGPRALTDKSKRRWFQFHPFTSGITMLSAIVFFFITVQQWISNVPESLFYTAFEIVFLVVIAFACEWLVRRRSARNPLPPP